jgi:predicted ArsR family transcriptional regulator
MYKRGVIYGSKRFFGSQTNANHSSQSIKVMLKENGRMTADELAEHLGISSVAVRRHLTKLESDQIGGLR